MRRIVRILTFGVLLLAGALALGFVGFARHVASIEQTGDARADGIVAFTGGASRISDALDLLAEERARRLLITGVNPSTSVEQIARSLPSKVDLFTCCVDLDRRALNTVGNATETRKWAERQGFHSLIVVTSNYHMPRSLAELRRALPQVELIPHPVDASGDFGARWWRDPRAVRLLAQEYAKYMVVIARQKIGTGQADTGFAQAGRQSGS